MFCKFFYHINISKYFVGRNILVKLFYKVKDNRFCKGVLSPACSAPWLFSDFLSSLLLTCLVIRFALILLPRPLPPHTHVRTPTSWPCPVCIRAFVSRQTEAMALKRAPATWLSRCVVFSVERFLSKLHAFITLDVTSVLQGIQK